MKANGYKRVAWVGASLVLHGLIGWALLRDAGPQSVFVEPPAMEVRLLAPPLEKLSSDRPRSAGPRTTIAAAPATRLPAPVRAAPHIPTSASPSPSSQITAPPGFVARGALTGGGEGLRRAARQSACTQADIVNLTKAEREACAEALGAKNKNGPALYAAIDPDRKAAFDGDCKKDDEWCLYRTGKGPYPGLLAIGRKKKIKGWD